MNEVKETKKRVVWDKTQPHGSKGVKKSTEHKEKMSKASKGVPKSEAHKEAMRLAQQRRRQLESEGY
jgi:hypothetical protein